jgi:hypothetical protein
MGCTWFWILTTNDEQITKVYLVKISAVLVFTLTNFILSFAFYIAQQLFLFYLRLLLMFLELKYPKSDDTNGEGNAQVVLNSLQIPEGQSNGQSRTLPAER